MLCLIAGGLTAQVASPEYSEVSLSVGLDFVGEAGEAFPPLDVRGVPQLMCQNMGNGVAVGDPDGDGDLDVYLLARFGLANRLYVNQLVETGSPGFVESTPSPLDDQGMSRTAHFVDFDGDGDEDLLLLNDDDGTVATGRSRVFRNDGGAGWTDVSEASGLRPIGYLVGGSALADFDSDGDVDVYVTYWTGRAGGEQGMYPGENRYYRNLGDLVFEDASEDVGLEGLSTDSFAVVASDFDDDDLLDLFVAVDHRSDEAYLRDGELFVPATAAVGATHVGNDMGAAFADLNGDLAPDIYTTNITDPLGNYGTTQGNALYIRRPGAVLGEDPLFVDEAWSRGAADTVWGWGVEPIDVDWDGDLDLVVATGFDAWIEARDGGDYPLVDTPTYVLVNDGSGHFARLTGTALDEPGDSRALVAFDYDRDGDDDVLVTGIDDAVRLYERQGAPSRWLTVRLERAALALSATVVVTVPQTSGEGVLGEGLILAREVLAARSYLVGAPPEASFAIPDGVYLVDVEVYWADGTVQNLGPTPTNQLLRVRPGIFSDGFELGGIQRWVAD